VQQALAPTGSLMPYAGTTTPPAGWLIANGQAVSRAAYPALFAAISTTYGAGDGSTTFNVPDLRGRMAVGADNMGGAPGAAGRLTANNTAGAASGAEKHTLTVGEMPSHNHGVTDPGHYHGTNGNYFAIWRAGDVYSGGCYGAGCGNQVPNVQFNDWRTGSSTTGISIQNTGGGAAFNEMNPYQVLNYIIKT
jgi:microcystin-dependent protein